MTNTVVFAVLAILVIAATVFVNEAVRRITVHYARRIRAIKSTAGRRPHLPLRVNQAGLFLLFLLFPWCLYRPRRRFYSR